MTTNKVTPRRQRSAKRQTTTVDPAAAASPVAMKASELQAAEDGPAVQSTCEPEREHALEHALEALSVDHATAERMQKLPHDIGWLLVTAGVVGVVMPGVLGVPFLVLGGLILLPGTNQRAERWLTGHSPKLFKGSIRQINRFLDDLERRYPRSPKK